MVVARARGLVKTFGRGRARRRVLDGVDLELADGELVAVVGPSGSGKSTLLHLLGGLDRAEAGTVEIAGQPLDADDRRAARLRARHLGFVFQAFHLVEELSAAENVTLPTRLPGAPSGGRGRARRLIADLGLAPVADLRPHELSGGERQRVALARALVNEPTVVLADEPTGSLDRAAAADALGRLRDVAGVGRAVVLVTHDRDAAAYADRVLELVDGRLGAGELAPRRLAR